MRLISLLFIFILTASQVWGYEIAFDCGGNGSFFDGKAFEADIAFPGTAEAGYLSGYVATPNANSRFGGPYQPATLCSKFRRGNVTYQFNVPDGDYAVTLYFSEYQVHGPGLRQFPIQFNRTVEETAFDIWDRSRMFYTFSVRYKVEAYQGVITASLGSPTETALLAGIALESIEDDDLAPEAPATVRATGSYQSINLSWELPPEITANGVTILRSQSAGGPFELVAMRQDLAPFWVDQNVTDGATYYYQLKTTNLYDQQSLPSPTVSATVLGVEDSTLPFYSITMLPEDLALLRQSPGLDLYYDAQLNLDGTGFGDAGARFRGSLSRTISSKKSWKIKPYTQLINGRDRFNLNGDYLDDSQMVPLISFACFKPTRCMTPEAQKASLMVNEEYRGLFTEVEQVNDLFIQARTNSPVGNIYKCNSDLRILSSFGYQNLYEKKTNTAFGNEDLISFIETINQTPASELDDVLFPLVNLESQVDYYATRIFTADYDYFMRNYYLYHNLTTDQWEFIPWDLDLALDLTSVLSSIDLGTSQTPSVNGWNRLFDRLISVPKYRRFYCDRLTELLDTNLSSEAFSTVTDSIANIVGPETERDFWKFRFDDSLLFPTYFNRLQAFGAQREAFLHSAIEPFLTDVNGLFINEVLVLNETTAVDEAQQNDSYIELFNWSDQPINLADFSLANGTSDPLAGTLPNEVLEPRSFAVFWADDEVQQGPHHLPFSLPESGGQIMLYHNSTLNTAVDSLAYTTQVPDVSLALPLDGWWPFLDAAPSPGVTNVVGDNSPPLFINEFMALNTATVTDPQGEYEDWVELYNPNNETVNLTGYYLSDDPNFPTRWTFPPGTTIDALGYLIIWCDSDPADEGLHTNFKLSAAGESIGLYGPAGTGNPVIDEYVFANQTADISLGRFPDGTEEWITFAHPTPGASNSSLVPVDETVFAVGLQLHPVSPNPSAGQTTIAYTLPGLQMAQIELDVFDVRGRKVRRLIQGQSNTGQNSIIWNRRDDSGRVLPSGVYFVRLKSLGHQLTRKMILVR